MRLLKGSMLRGPMTLCSLLSSEIKVWSSSRLPGNEDEVLSYRAQLSGCCAITCSFAGRISQGLHTACLNRFAGVLLELAIMITSGYMNAKSRGTFLPGGSEKTESDSHLKWAHCGRSWQQSQGCCHDCIGKPCKVISGHAHDSCA